MTDFDDHEDRNDEKPVDDYPYVYDDGIIIDRRTGERFGRPLPPRPPWAPSDDLVVPAIVKGVGSTDGRNHGSLGQRRRGPTCGHPRRSPRRWSR